MHMVDINSDLGEAFGSYPLGLDREIIPYVSSVNIACGWHAGDPMVMEETVRLSKLHGVAIGAHPGFPDLMGFGRRNMHLSPQEAKAYVKYQIGALMAFAVSHGLRLQHVKPHGAMYNMAAKDSTLARAIAEAIYEVDDGLILLGLAHSEMLRAGHAIGLRVASEVFADRAYQADGTLVPRSNPGAVIHDPALAIQRVIRMVKENKVTAITGEDISIYPQSICVHGDNPEAVAFVKAIGSALRVEGVGIAPLCCQ